MRRAKFAFTGRQMHRLLGLPDDVRVVALRAASDPDMVHVLVEGASLPAQEVHGTDYAQMAYHGAVEAAYLWHPSANRGVTWGDWRPGMGPDDVELDTPVGRSMVVARFATVLAEHGVTDEDGRLARELTNAVERLTAQRGELVSDGR